MQSHKLELTRNQSTSLKSSKSKFRLYLRQDWSVHMSRGPHQSFVSNFYKQFLTKPLLKSKKKVAIHNLSQSDTCSGPGCVSCECSAFLPQHHFWTDEVSTVGEVEARGLISMATRKMSGRLDAMGCA